MAFLQRRILPLTVEDAELAAEIFNQAGRKRVFKTDAVIAAVAIRAPGGIRDPQSGGFSALHTDGLEPG
jgi:predicted nucleic acid-binding protein